MKTLITLTAAIVAFAFTATGADAAPRPQGSAHVTSVATFAHGKNHQQARRLEGYTRKGKAVYSYRKLVGYDRRKKPIYRWVRNTNDRVVYKTYREYQRSRGFHPHGPGRR